MLWSNFYCCGEGEAIALPCSGEANQLLWSLNQEVGRRPTKTLSTCHSHLVTFLLKLAGTARLQVNMQPLPLHDLFLIPLDNWYALTSAILFKQFRMQLAPSFNEVPKFQSRSDWSRKGMSTLRQVCSEVQPTLSNSAYSQVSLLRWYCLKREWL